MSFKSTTAIAASLFITASLGSLYSMEPRTPENSNFEELATAADQDIALPPTISQNTLTQILNSTDKTFVWRGVKYQVISGIENLESEMGKYFKGGVTAKYQSGLQQAAGNDTIMRGVYVLQTGRDSTIRSYGFLSACASFTYMDTKDKTIEIIHLPEHGNPMPNISTEELMNAKKLLRASNLNAEDTNGLFSITMSNINGKASEVCQLGLPPEQQAMSLDQASREFKRGFTIINWYQTKIVLEKQVKVLNELHEANEKLQHKLSELEQRHQPVINQLKKEAVPDEKFHGLGKR